MNATHDEMRAAMLSHGVRDFSREPVNKIPDRHNLVSAGGNLRVSSDVLRWMNKLSKVAPRNAGVTFYTLNPAGSDYDKILKAQTKAQVALAGLGLCEGVEVVIVPAIVPDAPPAIVEPDVVPEPAKPSTDRRAADSVRHAIRRAFRDWLTGRAYLDNGGNYRVKDARTGKARGAKWNRLIKSTYPDNADFHRAAHASGLARTYARKAA